MPINNALFSLIREHYRDLQGYVSAGMEVKKSLKIVFMNANENPYELPGLEGLNRYPEPQPAALAEAYARAYGVEAGQVAMTRGADEAIVVLTKLFCEPHTDSVLISPPTFGMYGVDARAMPAGVAEVPLVKENGTFALDKEGIIQTVLQSSSRWRSSDSENPHERDPGRDGEQASPTYGSPQSERADARRGDDGRIKIVYICSPNNPTGTSFSHDTISEICEAVEGHAVVVLDEAYAEFAQNGSMTGDLESTPNLIILRTLSKAYALAGMRMGSMLCADTDFIALVKANGLDAYPLPRESIEAAFHVLSPEISALAQENIQKILADRDRMKAALEASDQVTYVYPSDANFLLVAMRNAKGFYDFAAQNDVILRDFSSKPGTENCLRISIGTPEENNLVLDLLGRFSAEFGNDYPAPCCG